MQFTAREYRSVPHTPSRLRPDPFSTEILPSRPPPRDTGNAPQRPDTAESEPHDRARALKLAIISPKGHFHIPRLQWRSVWRRRVHARGACEARQQPQHGGQRPEPSICCERELWAAAGAAGADKTKDHRGGGNGAGGQYFDWADWVEEEKGWNHLGELHCALHAGILIFLVRVAAEKGMVWDGLGVFCQAGLKDLTLEPRLLNCTL